MRHTAATRHLAQISHSYSRPTDQPSQFSFTSIPAHFRAVVKGRYKGLCVRFISLFANSLPTLPEIEDLNIPEMASNDTCHQAGEGRRSSFHILAITGLATIALGSLFSFTMFSRHPKILRSPLKTVIPTLSSTELDKLEYKPDAFPGARDVDTPVRPLPPLDQQDIPSLTRPSQYGSIRVYEWGPESGPKVFMIHGISTSCQTLTKLAHSLVESGCRVMLFVYSPPTLPPSPYPPESNM